MTLRCERERDNHDGPGFCGPCSSAIGDYVPWEGHTIREAHLLQPLAGRLRRYGEPKPIDLAHDLATALHGYSTATTETPSEAWHRLLDEVRALRDHPAVSAEHTASGHDCWWVIHGESLADSLNRTSAGERPDLVYAEMYAYTEPPTDDRA